jgi:hypothetical protein
MRGRSQARARRRSNKRMHATADTTDFIFGKALGRRVMRGVRRHEVAFSLRS